MLVEEPSASGITASICIRCARACTRGQEHVLVWDARLEPSYNIEVQLMAVLGTHRQPQLSLVVAKVHEYNKL